METIMIFVGVLFVAGALSAGIRIVSPRERGLIERLGRYDRFAEPGFHWLIPLVEHMRRVNITEQMIDVEPQVIITKDKLNAKVDAQIYLRVKTDEASVKASQYNVDDYLFQSVNLTRTTLRNELGTLTLNEGNSERGRINQGLMGTLTKETANWGLEIVKAELKEIDPPPEVQLVMNKVVIAENEKLAAVDFATALETRGDGEKRQAIRVSEGKAQSVKNIADADAYAIKIVNEAATQYFVGDAQILKKLEVTQNSLQNNSKIILTEKGISPVIVLGADGVLPVPMPKADQEKKTE